MAVDPLAPLQSKADALQSTLTASPSAYGGDQPAGKTGVENQTRLMSIQDQITKQRDIELKKQWGLNDTSAEGSPQAGLMGTAIDYLSRPLYGIVGATESALGKGVAPTMGQNISENISTGKRTFSDLLRKEGANYLISAPLGFALDVAMDPVNWATAGTTALIPRVASGLIKGAAEGGIRGGLEAAAAGAQSSLPGVMASRLVKKVGGGLTSIADSAIGTSSDATRNVVGDVLGKAGEKMSGATDAAANAATKYDALTGRDFMGGTLPKTGFGYPGGSYSGSFAPMSDYRITLGDLAKHAINTLPGGVGETIWKNMEYSNNNWLRIVRLKDALMKTEGVGKDVQKVMQGATIPEAGAEMAAKIRGAAPSTGPDIAGGAELFNDIPKSEVDKKLSAALSEIGRSDAETPLREGIKDATDLATNPALGTTADMTENTLRLASEVAGKPVLTLEDVRKLVNSGSMGETGIKWFDDMQNNIRMMKISSNANLNKAAPAIKSLMGFYDRWLTLFRAAKVTGSPSSIVNASIGNPAFYGMIGGDITDGKWWSELSNAAGFHLGTKKSSGYWQKMMDVPQIRQYLEENPTAVRTGFGIPVSDAQRKMTAEQLIRIAKDHGMLDMSVKATDPKVKSEMQDIVNMLNQAVAEGAVAGERVAGKVAGNKLSTLLSGKNAVGGLDETLKIMKEKGSSLNRYDLPTGMFSQEYMESPASRKMLDAVAEKAKTGGPMAKALNIWLNKAPSFYEGIDQSYKLGTFGHLTMNGVSERELNIMRRTVQMGPQDIMDKWNDNGMWRFRLAPDKAMEVITESYLNYAAMPGFIRMMRQMPVLGAPFISFAYGTSLKTLNSLATNPSFFNKAQFAMNDFGGSKSPIEKEALKGPYYNYLNNQTMFKLPFFQQNPVYMNLGYALPYYSLNAFSASGRSYKDVLPNDLVSFIDKSQLMGNPIGQVMFDYGILPHIISSTADPLGSFGQKLYPRGATTGQKSFYAARQLGESVIPGFMSAPGGLAQGLIAPGATENMPSYRWRQIAYATQGKDQYGVTRKEAPASRTLRNVLSSLGIPIQSPIDLTNVLKQKQALP
jgi:hypothetical protein